jgi:photosystem II stability/assembly factor-like uncharacterized protein
MQNVMWITITLFLLNVANVAAATNQPGVEEGLRHQDAVKLPNPDRAAILGATKAGQRIVAVGDRGAVLLSDDGGVHFHHAKRVPTRATLTSVSFVNASIGWAVGHWGIILRTDDAGETWSLQRDDLTVDQPLFSVWFRDPLNGIAVGLFSLTLRTSDGGRTWNNLSLPVPAGSKKADANLFRIVPGRNGRIYVAAERGLIYRSADFGNTWQVTSSGSKGSLWTGLVLDDDSVIVAGLRGNASRSLDDGKTWIPFETGTKSSITDLIQMANGQLFAVALDGVYLTSDDRGQHFTVHQNPDQRPYTAVTVNNHGAAIVFSQTGAVRAP